jgi:cell division protein FtsZ
MYKDLDKFEPVAKIIVIGVGGAGNNAVNRMIDENISNVEFYVANTDKQALSISKAPHKIILGENLTAGLGAGGAPEIGRKATEESLDEIKEILKDKDMLFIACGEGGGTGTGGAPVIAAAAKEMGILTVAIVTRPFFFEGQQKIAYSVQGINELSKVVDSLIIVSNDKLLLYGGNESIINAFSEADSVLARSVKTVTDIILTPYLINLDFADVRNVLKDSGVALIGYGMGSGANKAEDAAENALNSPLLETGIGGAKKCLLAVTCGPQVTLNDVQKSVNKIKSIAGTDIDLKVAINKNPALGDDILISIIAADFENADDILNGKAYHYNPEDAEKIVTKPAETVKNDDNQDNDIIPDFLKDSDDDK